MVARKDYLIVNGISRMGFTPKKYKPHNHSAQITPSTAPCIEKLTTTPPPSLTQLLIYLNMHLLPGDHLARVALTAALVPMPTADRVIVGRALDLASQLLERLPLRLGDQKRGEDTAEHEKREDLHDVVEPWRGGRSWRGSPGTERPEDALGDDGADLAGGGRETVRGGPVAGWETLARYNERGCVGAWVERSVN